MFVDRGIHNQEFTTVTLTNHKCGAGYKQKHHECGTNIVVCSHVKDNIFHVKYQQQNIDL